MAESTAHLTDHVFPHLPVRQWVRAVPKRLCYYLQRDKGALDAALRIFLRVVQGTDQLSRGNEAQRVQPREEEVATAQANGKSL